MLVMNILRNPLLGLTFTIFSAADQKTASILFYFLDEISAELLIPEFQYNFVAL